MTKTITFLLLATILFISSSIRHLLDPEDGFYFIVEEIIIFFLLVIGYFLFRNNIQRMVANLNKSLPWDNAIKKRLFKEMGLICLFTIALSSMLIIGSVVFFSYYGEPAYYVKKEQIKREQNRHAKEGENRRPLQEFSNLYLAKPILGGCFILFFTMFGLEETFNYNNYRQQQLLRAEQIAKEQALTKANALKKQLNPHFMFNTLNVLSGLMHEDLQKADQFLKKLSEIYRYFLEQSEEVVSTLQKELDFIESYIFLQKIRFEDKLRVQYQIPQNRLHWLIPTLTLELLIENAIKHNVISRTKSLTIWITIDNDYLIAKNNYQPRRDKEISSGIGIKNLQERLKLLEMPIGKFEIESGFFIATIPLINPEQ